MKKYFSKTVFLASTFLLPIVAGAQGVTVPGNTGLPGGTLADVIRGLTMWLLAIFGFLAIISFVISGIMYLVSAGDDKQQEKAKKQMMWSIIGVVIGLSGYIVVKAVDAWLRGGTSF